MPFIGLQQPKSPLTASDITDGIITTAKIANDAVTNIKIPNNAIGVTEIADDAVTLAKANDNFYKTGTFSVVFRDTAAASGNDSQTFTGLPYTKIGDLVSIYVFCQNITTTGMNDSVAMYMHGLPFKPRKLTPVTIWTSDVNLPDGDGSGMFFVATENANSGYFQRMTDNGTPITSNATQDFENGLADIAFQLTYHTNET